MWDDTGALCYRERSTALTDGTCPALRLPAGSRAGCPLDVDTGRCGQQKIHPNPAGSCAAPPPAHPRSSVAWSAMAPCSTPTRSRSSAVARPAPAAAPCTAARAPLHSPAEPAHQLVTVASGPSPGRLGLHRSPGWRPFRRRTTLSSLFASALLAAADSSRSAALNSAQQTTTSTGCCRVRWFILARSRGGLPCHDRQRRAHCQHTCTSPGRQHAMIMSGSMLSARRVLPGG